jgi:uncharacterized protein (TIGR02466 family)
VVAAVDRFELFGTPLRVFALDGVAGLNRELAAALTAEAESSSGIQRSNSGWHSVPDLSLRPEPCYQRLMQAVVDHVQVALRDVARAREIPIDRPLGFGVQAWAMVMTDGDYAVLHDHAQSAWSVVYYVDAGDADLEVHPDSGRLCFVDPRRAGAAIAGLDLFPSEFSLSPRSGMLAVFPGWLQHFVHPYRGQRPRISISCNLRPELAGE